MLTGNETLAEVFAATAHRCHRGAALVEPDGPGAGTTTWAALVSQVRLTALGWTSDGPREGDEVVLVPGSGLRARTVALLVAAATGAVATIPAGGAPGAALDLERLAAAGADVDERHPDRFELLLRGRSPSDALLRAGALVHTSASLLVAARSLGQALGMEGDARLEVALPEGSVAAVVAGSVLPCLTGDTSGRQPDVAAAGDSVGEPGRLVRLVVAGTARSVTEATPPGRSSRARRQARRSAVVEVLDAALVPSADADAVVAASALSLDAAGGLVTGFGAHGTVGRPLPGMSVAVEGDGEVLVRGAAVPPGAPGLRGDGWLPTGVRGRLVAGDLVLDVAARPGGA